MAQFELANDQRKYFGLDPIEEHWDQVMLPGDTYRPESILYFEKDVIKRHIVSTEVIYSEQHYDEQTTNREFLLPKTAKGKGKKLTASVLEQRQPTGIYLKIFSGHLTIASFYTQTTFYSTHWEHEEPFEASIPDLVAKFIDTCPDRYLDDIAAFKQQRKKHVAFQSGDYFCFKLDRTHFGFGRILLDVGKIVKKQLLAPSHGLGMFMARPVMIELFIYRSASKHFSIETLDKQPRLPVDVVMDNMFYYGEYEIIGNKEIDDREFDFPISYGQSIEGRKVVFLQWGLIHKELPVSGFNKYVDIKELQSRNNPYGYYGIGFRPSYDSLDIARSISNNGIYDFDKSVHYISKWDLRNPKNRKVRDEILGAFGLDSTRSYYENSVASKTILPSQINDQLTR